MLSVSLNKYLTVSLFNIPNKKHSRIADMPLADKIRIFTL